MGIAHAVQGSIMLFFSNLDFRLPINTNYLILDDTNFKLIPDPQTVLEVPIAPLVAMFLYLSALAHFLLIMPGIYGWYEKNIGKGLNPGRWYEYALSSSLMMVVISMLAGIYDLSSIILIFTINACMIFFGHVMEVHNQTTKRTDWLSYIYGCFAGIIPWLIVGLYLLNAGDGDAKPPTFVYYIFFSMFIFFNTFAVNMVLQYKKVGKWKDYTYGEKIYIVLSLVAKSLLAWQVWAGTLRPV